jgi:hypothetical protein
LFVVGVLAHHKSIFNSYKTLTSEGVFCSLLRASCFEARTRFRVPQNTTCRVPANTKIRPSGRIGCNRENGSIPFSLPSDLIKDFCINQLIKIILQSKPLFTKGLYSEAVPNTAFERQTMPR